jgi:hypothetical protein
MTHPLRGALCALIVGLGLSAQAISEEQALRAGPFQDGVDGAPGLTLLVGTPAPERAYGVWLQAPQSGCGPVRYVLSSEGRRLGASPPLQAGEGAVVPIGSGWQGGVALVRLEIAGCAQPPDTLRRVVLRRQVRDHGWRTAIRVIGPERAI